MLIYIRTKNDEVLESSEQRKDKEHDEIIYQIADGREFSESNVVKSSKSLHDILDGYWAEGYDDPQFIRTPSQAITMLSTGANFYHGDSISRHPVYGSIYIKGKGWKYVATLNLRTLTPELLKDDNTLLDTYKDYFYKVLECNSFPLIKKWVSHHNIELRDFSDQLAEIVFTRINDEKYDDPYIDTPNAHLDDIETSLSLRKNYNELWKIEEDYLDDCKTVEDLKEYMTILFYGKE